MKVKKVLNLKSDPKVVQLNELQKNESNDVLSSLSYQEFELPQDIVAGCSHWPTNKPSVESHLNSSRTQTNDIMYGMPKLRPLPDFYCTEPSEDHQSLPPLPPLKPLPAIIPLETLYQSPNHSDVDLNIGFESQAINNSVDTSDTFNRDVECVLDPILVSDLDRILQELPEILDVPPLDMSDIQTTGINTSVDSMAANQNCHFSRHETQTNMANVADHTNSGHNFGDQTQQQCSTVSPNTSKPNQSVVSIDLSDLSNSPQSLANSGTKETPIVSKNSSPQRKLSFISQPLDNERLEVSEPSTSLSPTKRSPLSVRTFTPYNYCAKNYRLFTMNGHFGRHKTSTQNDDFDYEKGLANASWDQIDGSKYLIKVKKWSEKDMNEDKRTDILRNVDQMNFLQSVYEDDRNVFYCWSAFEGQSNQRGEEACLKCMLRLDIKGFKVQRFSKYQTQLFLLYGSASVSAENCKQTRIVEVGQEVLIPPHTRFELESKSIESSYFYVIVSNRNSF